MSAQVTSATGNYTWDIPSDFSINSGNPLNISISDADIGDDQILEVTVASQNGFKLKSESNQEITYELYESGNQSPLASNASVLKYQPGKTNKVSNSLSAQTVSMPDNLCSGNFKDTLVFTSGVNSDPDYAYSITYNLNGGTLSGDYPTSYTSSAGLSTLPTPTKDGYVFAGWQENNDVPVTINDKWGKNEDGSIYIDPYHYGSQISPYVPAPRIDLYNTFDFNLTKNGKIESHIKFITDFEGASFTYQIVKDDEIYLTSESLDTANNNIEYDIKHNLPAGNYVFVAHIHVGMISSVEFSNLSVQETTDITSIPSGTTGDKTLTAKWNKIITFNIGKTSYQANDGMTWEEWVNSEYNSGSYEIVGNYVHRTSGAYVRTDSNSVLITDVIVNGYSYKISHTGGGAN